MKDRRASRFVGIRLNQDDQSNLRAILESGLADTITDAIRYGLDMGARAVRRLTKKGK